MKYRVSATRTTLYEVEAENEKDAIDRMMNGEAAEVDGTTERIDAEPLCPVCDNPLSDTTTRTVTYEDETREEPTYCATCDREVAVTARTA